MIVLPQMDLGTLGGKNRGGLNPVSHA
jgi:hypothetical protein